MNSLQVRRERDARLHEAHIRPLTDFVDELRAGHPDRDVPYFDPASGGVAAKMLVLLEAPGPLATGAKGSNFVSLDNDDRTAAALWKIVHDRAIPRHALAVWNIVPWYVGNASRISAPTSEERGTARPWLLELLRLLPDLKVAILLGRSAQLGWLEATSSMPRPLPVVASHHPSPRAWAGQPQRRDEIAGAFAAAARVAGLTHAEAAG